MCKGSIFGLEVKTPVLIMIKNMPSEIQESGYLVARRNELSAELWYYNFYKDKNIANRVALEIGNGVVLETGI